MQNRSDHRSSVFISKKMSHCLRHNPGKYGLKLDEYGFVDLQDFLDAMNRMHHFQPKLRSLQMILLEFFVLVFVVLTYGGTVVLQSVKLVLQ